jgi:hypothetical protein
LQVVALEVQTETGLELAKQTTLAVAVLAVF